MFYWENIRNIFNEKIPKNFEFNGISKLNIQFSDTDLVGLIEPDTKGIAVYQRNDFSFDKFQSLSENEKDNVSLGYIENSLIEIADLYGNSESQKEIVRSISNSIRENAFILDKVHRKTTKWHGSRKFRAVTTLQFKKGGIDVVLEIVGNDGASISKYKIIESWLWESVWSSLWKGSWAQNSFVIEDRFGEVFFETDNCTEE